MDPKSSQKSDLWRNSLRLDKTVWMFCAQCGSSVDEAVCYVCGNPATQLRDLEPTSQILAGWWSRVGATLIDSLILLMPTLVLVLLLGNLLGEIAAITAQATYMIYLLTRGEGQTLGNRAVHTRVRDALTGQTISRGQAFVRWGVIAVYGVLGTLPSAGTRPIAVTVSALAVADCLYPLFNSRRQSIHDRLAHTIVVHA